MEYTYCSTDPEHYNTIFCPINSIEGTNQVQWQVTSISSFCNIVALGTDDYISINGVKYYVQQDINRVDTGYFDELNTIIEGSGVISYTDRCGRYIFYSDDPFTIDDASYRMKQGIGLYNEEFPIEVNTSITDYKFSYRCKSSGYEMCTPVLILLSNLGAATTLGDSKYPLNYKSCYVAMKFPNSMTPGQPLIASGTEAPITVQGTALSNIRLELVDFNFHPVELLSPLYATISVQPLPYDEATEQALAPQPQNREFISKVNAYVTQTKQELVQKTVMTEEEINNPLVVEERTQPLSSRFTEDKPAVEIEELVMKNINKPPTNEVTSSS